jgi:hypothetical protein
MFETMVLIVMDGKDKSLETQDRLLEAARTIRWQELERMANQIAKFSVAALNGRKS